MQAHWEGLLLVSELYPLWSEADGRARETSTSHLLLSAGGHRRPHPMRVTLEPFQEHAPSRESVAVGNPQPVRACSLRPHVPVSYRPAVVLLLNRSPQR